MTMLVAWTGVDTHGFSSAYILADSRITWGEMSHFDSGRKVFSSKVYPEIFGYSGDVLFPTMVLSQVIEMIDSGILIHKEMPAIMKKQIIFKTIGNLLAKYPKTAISSATSIIYVTRDNRPEKYPDFKAFQMNIKEGNRITTKEVKLNKESGHFLILGSGKRELSEVLSRYSKGKNHDTTRNVFHSFISALENTNDPCVGGPPQMVGLYRKPNSAGNNFGLIYHKKRYYLGIEVAEWDCISKIPWRNHLFEICDGNTKSRKEGCAAQPDHLRCERKATP